MKNVFSLFVLAFAFSSCKKENPDPSPQPSENTLTISSFQPTAGVVGTTVIITGNHFDGVNKQNNVVKFNGVTAVVEDASGTQLRVTVPGGAVTGKISVQVANKSAVSTNAFTVTPSDPGDPVGWTVSTFLTGLTFPRGMVKDEAGNLYITDMHTIQKIQPNGTISVYAGTGAKNSTDGDALNEASFDQPTGLAFDSKGNLFVADQGNHVIRKISSDGRVTTFAGKAGAFDMVNATGENARFSAPYAIAIDAQDNLYVTDLGNSLIRKITPNREVSTFAGNGTRNSSDATVGINAGIPQPGGITIDEDGILYVTERGGGKIRKINPSGTVAVSTIGGELSVSFMPSGIVVDKEKNVYVAYTGLNKIKKITPAGLEQDFAGNGDANHTDGPAGEARFFNPEGLVLIENANGSKTFFVADRQNKKIRKIVFEE